MGFVSKKVTASNSSQSRERESLRHQSYVHGGQYSLLSSTIAGSRRASGQLGTLVGKAGSGRQRWPHRYCQVPEHIPAPQRAWCRGSLQLSRALGAFLSVPQFPPCFLRRHPGAATALPRDGEQGEQRGGTVTVAEHGEMLARGWAGGPAGGRAVPCRAVPCVTGRCCAIRYHTSPCRAVPCSAPPSGPSLPSSGAAARFQPPGTTRLLPCPPRCPRSSSRSDQRSEGPRGADPAAGPGATTGARGGPGRGWQRGAELGSVAAPGTAPARGRDKSP